jgi:hypothetical protein
LARYLARCRAAVLAVAVVLAGALPLSPVRATHWPAEWAPAVASSDLAGATAEEQSGADLATIAESLGALGIFYDFDTDAYVVVLSDGASPLDLGLVGTKVRIRTEWRPIKAAEISAIVAELAGVKIQDGGILGIYFDPRSGRVVAETTGAAEPYAAIVKDHEGSIDFRSDLSGGEENRNADGAPHWGGAVIVSNNWACSSGYTVKRSNGTKFMVSAAHCADNVGEVIRGGTGLLWGGVTDRGPYPTWDVMLISGNYDGRIYSGNFTGTPQSVKGAADPVVGSTSYCVSGWASTEHCSHHAVSLNGQLCSLAGCTPGLAVFQDGSTLTQDGDSGGPWYNYPAGGGVTIRGSHVGRIGGDMYAERWLNTKAHWTLTIVTA